MGQADSPLVATCHRLRRKPLNHFTSADLRIMIEQQISLSCLMPIAIENLEEVPLIEATFYRGDLLEVVLRVGEPFWATHADSFQRVCRIVERVKTTLPSLNEIEARTIEKALAASAFDHLK